mgnify:CR=1 FL=1
MNFNNSLLLILVVFIVAVLVVFLAAVIEKKKLINFPAVTSWNECFGPFAVRDFPEQKDDWISGVLYILGRGHRVMVSADTNNIFIYNKLAPDIQKIILPKDVIGSVWPFLGKNGASVAQFYLKSNDENIRCILPWNKNFEYSAQNKRD